MGAELDRHIHPAERLTADGISRTRTGPGTRELHVFVQFPAKAGCERRVEQAILKVVEASREEPGCVAIHAFRAVRDGRRFYIHSIWRNDAAFNLHGDLPHTVAFLEEVSAFIDRPVQPVRTRFLA
jgi:quinol monooxygenase YgiN